MAEPLEILRILEEHMRLKRGQPGYAETNLFYALALDPLVEGDYSGAWRTLREDVGIQTSNGCKEIPNLPTTEYFRDWR
jgi:hypothetical protein